MLTETEARELWCHYPERGLCNASKCMAWRWERKPGGRDEATGSYDNPIGYCGLAGKP